MNYKVINLQSIDVLLRRDMDDKGHPLVIVMAYAEDDVSFEERHILHSVEAAHDFIGDFSEAAASRFFNRIRAKSELVDTNAGFEKDKVM